MKLFDCFIAASIGYISIVVGFVMLGVLSYLISIPSVSFYFMALSAAVVTPLILGFVLGLRWPAGTIAYDEILPACMKTLLLFGLPWLLVPQIVPFYLLALPLTICETVFGTKIGISARHHRLIDELLGRWSLGENK